MTRQRTIIWGLVLTIGPFVVVFSFFATLFREVGKACWYAWNDAMLEISSMRREFSGREIQGEDE